MCWTKLQAKTFSKIWLSVKNRLSLCWQSIFKVFCLCQEFFQNLSKFFQGKTTDCYFMENRFLNETIGYELINNRLSPVLSQNALNRQNHLKTGYDIFNNRLFSPTTDCQLCNNRLLISKSVRYLLLDCCIIGYCHTDNRLCRRISGQIFPTINLKSHFICKTRHTILEARTHKFSLLFKLKLHI